MTTTSVLELRGGILTEISQVEDAGTLEQLSKFISAFLHRNEPEWWDLLSPEEQAEIDEALADLDNPEIWVSDTEAKKELARWLK